MKYVVIWCTINWIGIIIPIIWIVVGIVIAEIFECFKSKFKSNHRIKILKAIEGVYKAREKDRPKITNAIINVKRKEDSDNVIEFSGTSCKASDYKGTILINEINPTSGTGCYIHKKQNVSRGEFIGFGTIDININSDGLIVVVNTFQSNKVEYHNPEIWKRLEGDDINKPISQLIKEYMKINKDNATKS